MALEGKYGLSVVTSGGGDELPIIEYLNRFLINAGAIPVDGVWAEMGTTSKNNKLDKRIIEQAFISGKNLVEAWKSNRRLATVERIQDAHQKRMRELIRYHQTDWAYEYNYWQERDKKDQLSKMEA